MGNLMTKVEYTLDQPATDLLRSALADSDAETVMVLLKSLGNLDFIGGFCREVTTADGKKINLSVGQLNQHYWNWCIGSPRDERLEAPQWNWQIDEIWRGKEVKSGGVIV